MASHVSAICRVGRCSHNSIQTTLRLDVKLALQRLTFANLNIFYQIYKLSLEMFIQTKYIIYFNWQTTMKTGGNCSLHVSQQLSNLYPSYRAVPILSKKSAVGIIMATGTVNTTLKGRLGVYMSKDGALTWRQVWYALHIIFHNFLRKVSSTIILFLPRYSCCKEIICSLLVITEG